MEEKVPARILALAEQSKGVPISWREDETSIVVVYADGRKITYLKHALRPESEPLAFASTPARATPKPKPTSKKGKVKP